MLAKQGVSLAEMNEVLSSLFGGAAHARHVGRCKADLSANAPLGVDEIGGDALMACYQATIDTALAGMAVPDAALRRTFPGASVMVASGCFCPSGCEAGRQACEAGGACGGRRACAGLCDGEKTPVLDVVYEDADVLLVNKRPGNSRDARTRAAVRR